MTTNKKGRPLKFETVEGLEKLIEAYYERCEVKDKPLTLSGLSVWIGIDRKTLYNYSKKEDFFPTIKEAKDRIQADMEERALTGDSNATFSIFSFKNNFGWVNLDKVESENTNTNVNKNIDMTSLTDEQLDKILKSE